MTQSERRKLLIRFLLDEQPRWRGAALPAAEDAEKIATALKIDIAVLLDDYTRFTAPGYGQRICTIRKALCMSQ